MNEQRGTKEVEHGDDYVNTILFTALTALLMTYLKRAAATMLVVEQWRIWVFLFLNLVLLAIAFSSMFNNNNNNNINNNNSSNNNELGSEQNRERHDKDLTAVEETESKHEKKEEVDQCQDHESGENCDVDEPEPEHARLSKEELNERAEAFIVMFRQHLVLDAMNGRSNHVRDSIQLSEHSQVHLLQAHG